MITQIIDGIVSAISPAVGAKRAHARQVMRGYQGAESTRLTAHKKPKNQSAESEMAGPFGADSARAWARMLVRDNCYCSGIIDTIVSSVVGCGIETESLCEHHKDDEKNARINEKRNKVWLEWAEVCDITGQLTFAEMQALAQREIAEAGEVLIHKITLKKRKHNGIYRPVPFALEIIEADRLATDMDTFVSRQGDGTRITRGVESDEVGKPIAYWIYPDHPTSAYQARLQPIRIPAEKILHLFRRDRVGQTRGVTWLAPVIQTLRDMQLYLENELTASAVASCFTVAIKTEHQLSGLNPTTSDDDTTDSVGNNLEYLQPGIVSRLKPGESIESANPGRPNSAAEPWINLLLRGIAVGTGLSYEKVARDFSQTSFSSNRASELEDRRRFRRWQQYLIQHMLQPVWDGFTESAALIGHKDFPSMDELLDDRRHHACVEFHPPSWEWVDPATEQAAAEAGIRSFTNSYQGVLGGLGKNWQKVMTQRAREERLLDKLGLVSPAAEVKAQAEAATTTAEAVKTQAETPTNGQANGQADAKKKESERHLKDTDADHDQQSHAGGGGGKKISLSQLAESNPKEAIKQMAEAAEADGYRVGHSLKEAKAIAKELGAPVIAMNLKDAVSQSEAAFDETLEYLKKNDPDKYESWQSFMRDDVDRQEFRDNWTKQWRRRDHRGGTSAFSKLNEARATSVQNAINVNYQNKTYRDIVKNGPPERVLFMRSEKGMGANGEYKASTTRMYDTWTTPITSNAVDMGKVVLSGGNAGILRHEYGHHLMATKLTPVDRKEWKAFYGSNVEQAKEVSGYASSNADEFFAETFTLATHPKFDSAKAPAFVQEATAKVLELARK